jgi:hypothetical protein
MGRARREARRPTLGDRGSIEDEMMWGNGNNNDTEETMRQGDVQRLTNATRKVRLMTRMTKGVRQHARHAKDVREMTTGRSKETVTTTRQKMRHTEHKEVGTTDQKKL